MARYETSFFVRRPPDVTFAFISDFRNAVTWDPRTYAVDKTPEGPIGFGTTFFLTGGMLPKSGPLADRLPRALLRGMPLPYKVAWFDPPREFALEGETPVFTYADRITFVGEGDGTRVTYSARLDFRGVLGVGELFLRILFKKIGDDATRDIPAVIERATPAA